MISEQERKRFREICDQLGCLDDDIIGDLIRVYIWLHDNPGRLEEFHEVITVMKGSCSVITVRN